MTYLFTDLVFVASNPSCQVPGYDTRSTVGGIIVFVLGGTRYWYWYVSGIRYLVVRYVLVLESLRKSNSGGFTTLGQKK